MKGCELCSGVARMYCESDDASLCWNCDHKVHRANFLVAKHCRSLLCQICQSPTTWRASGPKLGPTLSICQSCFSLRKGRKSNPEESHTGNCLTDDDSSDGHSDQDDADDEEADDDEEEEEGENQVVPWSVTSGTPPVVSSSNSDDISSKFGSSALKRSRENSTDLDSDDDQTVCSSRHTGFGKLSNDETNPMCSNRPLKQARTGRDDDDDEASRSQANEEIASIEKMKTEMRHKSL